MENKLKIIIISLVVGLLITSCNTYQTFYSETFTLSNLDVPDTSLVLRLDVSNSDLDKEFLKWESFTELKMLNLSKNEEVNLQSIFDKIPNPEKLRVLVLDNMNLKRLPENITRFNNLTQLSLNGNPNLDWTNSFQLITELPIQFLDLQNNDIRTLDTTISEIKSIKDLNLSHNNLNDNELFISLSKLPSLYSLWLGYNNLESLPTEIGELKQLRNFYVPHNNLSEFPPQMAKMDKVWVIHAEYNKFDELPIVLVEMPSLFSIHIGNCNIERIPSAFGTAKYSMKGLVMDHNQLTESDKIKWRKEFNNFFLLSIE